MPTNSDPQLLEPMRALVDGLDAADTLNVYESHVLLATRTNQRPDGAAGLLHYAAEVALAAHTRLIALLGVPDLLSEDEDRGELLVRQTMGADAVGMSVAEWDQFVLVAQYRRLLTAQAEAEA